MPKISDDMMKAALKNTRSQLEEALRKEHFLRVRNSVLFRHLRFYKKGFYTLLTILVLTAFHLWCKSLG